MCKKFVLNLFATLSYLANSYSNNSDIDQLLDRCCCNSDLEVDETRY